MAQGDRKVKTNLLAACATLLCTAPFGLLAQVSGDVDTLACRETQLSVQDAVAAGEPYRNRGQRVRTAARLVSSAESAATITEACSSCIVSQFGRRIPVDEQVACGPDPVCGDGVCSANESLSSCPSDCGAADVIGASLVPIPRSDVCGRFDGRLCESLIGDVIADAMRTAYAADFALTNAGGIRADLTCPGVDNPLDFCPPYVPPPYPITRGQVFAVLPFGNKVATVVINGAELKAMLENGVSTMPAANGRFPQVSGLCFSYNALLPAGSRVTGSVRQAADGSCTGPAIDLTAGAQYLIAINDFIGTGGDGYPNFSGRLTLGELLNEVVSDHVTARSPLNPAIQGRIQCAPNPGCPAGSP